MPCLGGSPTSGTMLGQLVWVESWPVEMFCWWIGSGKTILNYLKHRGFWTFPIFFFEFLSVRVVGLHQNFSVFVLAAFLFHSNTWDVWLRFLLWNVTCFCWDLVPISRSRMARSDLFTCTTIPLSASWRDTGIAHPSFFWRTEVKSDCTTWYIWNIIPWRFGRSFSFLDGWFVGSMLIFQGVNHCNSWDVYQTTAA